MYQDIKFLLGLSPPRQCSLLPRSIKLHAPFTSVRSLIFLSNEPSADRHRPILIKQAAAGNSQLLLRERHFIAYPTEIQQKAMLKCNLKMLEMYFRRPYNRVIESKKRYKKR